MKMYSSAPFVRELRRGREEEKKKRRGKTGEKREREETKKMEREREGKKRDFKGTLDKKVAFRSSCPNENKSLC